MTQSTSDQPTTVADSTNREALTPAALATGVAALANNGQAVGAGALPMWDRVAQTPRRTWASRLFFLAAWCVTLLLIAIAVLRIGYHDGDMLLIWVNAFTLYVYLPAYAILAIAVWRRRWWLAAASVAVVACHVTWIAPDFRPAAPYQPPASPAAHAGVSQSVRVFYVNLRAMNEDYDGILGEIASTDPDVVVLVEFYRWLLRGKSPQWDSMMKPYVHGTPLDARHPGEVVVFSKLPLTRQTKFWAAGRVCQELDVQLAGDSLRLFCLHSPRPNTRTGRGYEVYWEKVTQRLAEQPKPLLVIGDFNATQHSSVYQRLTATGLRSAHVDRGRGYATTWPNGQYLLPPIRIDHALLSAEVECLDIAEGEGSGSDHKPLVLDVRIHAAEGPATAAADGG